MVRKLAILALVASCLSAVVLVEAEVASKEFLQKQKIVYQLFWRPDQPELQPEFASVAKSYKLDQNLVGYKHPEFITQYLYNFKNGVLPRGEVFSLYSTVHLKEAVDLFKLFYWSKNFETLWKTAAWARLHYNEGMFAYAFSIAVLHHPDTQGIRIPPLHEYFPELYFDSQIIHKAYYEKASAIDTTGKYSVDHIIVPETNTSFYHFDEEYMLRYFTEDVSVNDILYWYHLAYPFWLSAEEFPEIEQFHGDRYFYNYKFQYARYALERLSNGLEEIDDFDWESYIPYGYHPRTSYSNGLAFPYREEYSEIPAYNYKWLQEIRKWEAAFAFAVDMGYFIQPNGTFAPFRNVEGLSVLGNFFAGNENSFNRDVYGAYDRVSKTVLGASPVSVDKYKVLPSTLQHYGLEQRDPMYWSFAKKIVRFYEKFMEKLPKYTQQQLTFSDVEIESVDIDRITTFFEPYDYLISGGVKAFNPEDKLMIKTRQYRLNHKPYSYTVTVKSEKKLKANVRVFLGPSFAEKFEYNDFWKFFLPLDQWIVDLEAGINKIERNNSVSYGGFPEDVTGDIFWEKILNALEGKETYEIPENWFGYPERMVIPRGTTDGYPFQLFVFIAPYTGEEAVYHTKYPLFVEKEYLNVPLGYPFDRPIEFNINNLPNAYFKQFEVYHVEESDINATV